MTSERSGSAAVSEPRRWLGLGLLALLVAIDSWRFVAEPVATGLDPSYRFAFNLLADGELRVGRDVLFTYGPWGFVLFPQPLGQNILVANLVRLLVQLVMCAQLLNLALPRCLLPEVLRRRREPALPPAARSGPVLFHRVLAPQGFVALALVILTSALLTSFSAAMMLFCVTYLAVMLRRELPGGAGRAAGGVLAVAAPALAFMMKPAYGILATAVVLADAGLEALVRRRVGELVRDVLALVVAVAALWSTSGAGAGDLGAFLMATVEFARGNSSAMTISLGWSWYLLVVLGAWLLWLTLTGVLPRRPMAVLALACLPWLKYALARPDHVGLLLDLAVTVLVALVLQTGGWRVRLTRMAVLLLATALMASAVRTLPFANTRRFSMATFWAGAVNAEGLGTLGRLAQNETRERLTRQSRFNTRRLKLSKGLLATVDGQPLDVYPWNVSYVYANDLTWRPRPVFQSYLAYTPWLDGRNAEFLQGPSAPTFVLWEMRARRGPVHSIDLRYLPNDEPQTMEVLASLYRICRVERKVALLKRHPMPAFAMPNVVRRVRTGWARWIEVPYQGPGTVMRARIRLRRTAYGWARRVLYKEKDLYVYYRFGDGTVSRFRLVPDQAPGGIWVSPMIVEDMFRRARQKKAGAAPGCTDRVPWTAGKRVHHIRMLHRTRGGYQPDLDITWEALSPSR